MGFNMSNVYDLIATIMPYSAFVASAPEIPKLYWDVKSQEQRIKNICCELKKVIEYSELTADTTNQLTEKVNELTQLFEQFQESGFDDYYEQQVHQWIESNLSFIFEETVKQVYFGINEQGYFVAYIPDSWSDIIFDTGADYTLDTYGRLILRWDVDNQNETINQTPEPNSKGVN